MQLRHERKMYPPRVKMTVAMKNSDHVMKLPVRIEGCSGDYQLDTELTFPLGMTKSVSINYKYIIIVAILTVLTGAERHVSTHCTVMLLL